jgi:hypothetical protein
MSLLLSKVYIEYSGTYNVDPISVNTLFKKIREVQNSLYSVTNASIKLNLIVLYRTINITCTL